MSFIFIICTTRDVLPKLEASIGSSVLCLYYLSTPLHCQPRLFSRLKDIRWIILQLIISHCWSVLHLHRLPTQLQPIRCRRCECWQSPWQWRQKRAGLERRPKPRRSESGCAGGVDWNCVTDSARSHLSLSLDTVRLRPPLPRPKNKPTRPNDVKKLVEITGKKSGSRSLTNEHGDQLGGANMYRGHSWTPAESQRVCVFGGVGVGC